MKEQLDQRRASRAGKTFLAGWAVMFSLAAVAVFLLLLPRIPSPDIPPPMLRLQAAGDGERMVVFHIQFNRRGSSSGESWRMKVIEGDRVGSEEEIKPFYSVTAFSESLWFFGPGFYRMFDGRDWKRFEAPWIGEEPAVGTTPAQLWLVSRIGGGYWLASYTQVAWDRPFPVRVDLEDEDSFCDEHCPSRLVIFDKKIHYFWLKNGTLFEWIFDGENFGPVQSLGRMSQFEALAVRDQIVIWYLPVKESPRWGMVQIGVKVFNGKDWSESGSIEAAAPLGWLEMSPVSIGERTHLVMNNGVQIKHRIWGEGEAGPEEILVGRQIGPSIARYLASVSALAFIVIGAAAAGLSSVLNRWKPAEVIGDPSRQHSPVRYASVWRRFQAKAVDTVIVLIPVVGVTGWRMDPAGLLYPESLVHVLLTDGIGFTLIPILFFAYHALAEGIWGWTPGKRLFRLVVVDPGLKPCGLLKAVVRNLFRVVDGAGHIQSPYRTRPPDPGSDL